MFATPASLKKDYKQQYKGDVLKNAAIDRAYLRAASGASAAATGNDDAEIAQRILTECRLTLDSPISIECVTERLGVIREQQRQLEVLRAIPVIEQRTPEWYEARSRLVTASSLAQALGLGKYKSQKDFIIEKCGYKDVPFTSSPPLVWGTKFEAVAADIYARRNGTRLYEFGLIAHPNVSFFGASPDGITETGTMLEIKCPYRRKITGEIPQEYFYQIQGQLDVCDLNECDYIECGLVEYDGGFEEFARDTRAVPIGDAYYSLNMCEKGVMLECTVQGEDKARYVYGPANASPEATNAWVTAESERLYSAIPNIEYVKQTYWKLTEYMCKRVFRDRAFMDARYIELEHVWNKILLYRQNRELYDREIDPPTVAQTKTITIRGAKKGGGGSSGSGITLDLTDHNPVNVFSIDTSKASGENPLLTSYSFKQRENDGDECW